MDKQKKEVFISYHMSSSTKLVECIADELEQAGIGCWYAPRDCEDVFSKKIVAAIRECKVFLFIMNEGSSQSEHCLSEVAVAFNRRSVKEEISILPCKIEECDISDALYYYLVNIHIWDASCPPEEERIHELVQKIRVLLNHKPQVEMTFRPSFSKKANTYQLVGEVVSPDNSFLGRNKELQIIHEQMQQVDNKIFLAGMGGIGKSEIAKAYIKKYHNEYDVTLLVDFSNSLCETIASDSAVHIKGLSRSDFPNDDTRAYMERKLSVLKEMTDRRILIVMDNFDVESDPDLEKFCAGKYSVIFTTRNHHVANNVRNLEILPMTDEKDLMDLFRISYPRQLDETGEKYVMKIIHLLDGHTLCVRLVSRIMAESRISPARMYEMMTEGLAQMENANAKAAGKIKEELHRFFRLSSFTSEESYIMKNLSLIANSGIPVEMFYELCQMQDFEIIDGLINKSWIIHDVAHDKVHLHPLIGELMQEQLSTDMECCTAYIQNLYNLVYDINRVRYETRLLYKDLAQSLVERLPGNHPMLEVALHTIAEVYMTLGIYKNAEKYYKAMMSVTKNDYYRLRAYYRLAHMAILSGEEEKGLKIALEGFEIVKSLEGREISGEMINACLEVIGRIAESSRSLGDYETAEKYYFIIHNQQLKKDDPTEIRINSSMGWSYYHISNNYFLKGEYDLGEEYAKESARRFQVSKEAWAYAHSLNLMSYFLAKKKEYEKALEYNQEAMDILVPMQGSRHFGTGKMLESKGDLFAEAGRKEEAYDCWRQAIEIFEETGFSVKAENARKKIPQLEKDEFVLIMQP